VTKTPATKKLATTPYAEPASIDSHRVRHCRLIQRCVRKCQHPISDAVAAFLPRAHDGLRKLGVARARLAELDEAEKALAQGRQLYAEAVQKFIQRRSAIAASLHQWEESVADLFYRFEQSFSRHPMTGR
jgi:hypothetical protein